MTGAGRLFDTNAEDTFVSKPRPTVRARDVSIARPVRGQAELPFARRTLDEQLPAAHPVRGLWSVIDSLDLSRLEARVRSNTRIGGRPAIDPRVLLTIWVYGTTQGEARAAELARRTRTDDVFRWICGGLEVCDRTLSGFRAENGDVFDQLLTKVIAVLLKEELVEVWRIAQDGTRVRANAGAGSYKRLSTLDDWHTAARAHYEAVVAASEDPMRGAREAAAAERGARERLERIERAQQAVKEIAQERAVSVESLDDKKTAPRASVTDPDARRMKMGDGGFRPAYNVQFATAADGSGAIVGVTVTNRGTDQGEMVEMVAQVEERTGRKVVEHLVDAGYAQADEIDGATLAGTTVFAPLPKRQAAPGSRRRQERSAETQAWYARMESAEAASTYKLRSQVAELTNANAKSRYGLSVLVVRGLTAALGCALLVALTNNIELLAKHRATAAAAGVVPGSARVTG